MSTRRTDTSDFKYLVRSRASDLADDSIYDKLLQFSQEKEKKKLKCFPAKCVMEIREWHSAEKPDEAAQQALLCLNPSLLPLAPLPAAADSEVPFALSDLLQLFALLTSSSPSLL